MTTTASGGPYSGMIGLTQIAGSVGKGIEFGQWLNGDGFEIWEHAFVLLPGNLILEAEPGKQGAQINNVSRYSNIYWCYGIYKLLPPATPDAEIAHVGESMKGIPYSFLDYAALATHRLHIPAPGLKHYIQTSGHEICSPAIRRLLLQARRAHLRRQTLAGRRDSGFSVQAGP